MKDTVISRRAGASADRILSKAIIELRQYEISDQQIFEVLDRRLRATALISKIVLRHRFTSSRVKNFMRIQALCQEAEDLAAARDFKAICWRLQRPHQAVSDERRESLMKALFALAEVQQWLGHYARLQGLTVISSIDSALIEELDQDTVFLNDLFEIEHIILYDHIKHISISDFNFVSILYEICIERNISFPQRIMEILRDSSLQKTRWSAFRNFCGRVLEGATMRQTVLIRRFLVEGCYDLTEEALRDWVSQLVVENYLKREKTAGCWMVSSANASVTGICLGAQ